MLHSVQVVDILHYFTAYLLKCKTTLSYSKRYDTTVLHNIDFKNKVTCLVAIIMFNVPSVITIKMENVSVPSPMYPEISFFKFPFSLFTTRLSKSSCI